MHTRLRRGAAALATVMALALFAVPAHADGVAPTAASPLEREQAQGLFLRAKERFEQKDYREALSSFRASLAVVNSPNTRLYVGRCLRELGDPLGAYVEFGRAASEAREAAAGDGRYKLTAEEATAERDGVQPELGFLTIRLNGADPGIQLRVSGHPVRSPSSNDEPWPVMPGNVEVLVERDGAVVARRTARVERGAKESIDIAVPPPPPPVVAESKRDDGRGLRTGGFIAGGVGVAGLATFAIFGLMAKSTYNDLKDRCGGTDGAHCPPGVSDDVSSGSTKQTIANVGLVVGALGVATGVTLFAIGQGKKSSSSSGALSPPRPQSASRGPCYAQGAVSLVPAGNGLAICGGL